MLVEAEQIAQSLRRSGPDGTHSVMDRPGALHRRQAKGSRRLLSKGPLLSPGLRRSRTCRFARSGLWPSLLMQGRFKESLQMLNQAIPLLEREKSQHETLFAYVHRGMAQTWLGHYPAGLSDINRTLEIARSSRDQNAEIMARVGLTLIHILAGEYADGIAMRMKPWPSRKKAAIPFFATPLNGFIAWGTFGFGNARESLPYWAASAEAAKVLGGRLLLGELFAAVEAESLIEAVGPEAGLRRAQEALSLSQDTESIIGEALAERAIGRAIAARGHGQEEALPHIERSLEICETVSAQFEVVRGLLAKGEALIACGNSAEATTVLTEARALARERHQLDARSQSHRP